MAHRGQRLPGADLVSTQVDEMSHGIVEFVEHFVLRDLRKTTKILKFSRNHLTSLV